MPPEEEVAGECLLLLEDGGVPDPVVQPHLGVGDVVQVEPLGTHLLTLTDVSLDGIEIQSFFNKSLLNLNQSIL